MAALEPGLPSGRSSEIGLQITSDKLFRCRIIPEMEAVAPRVLDHPFAAAQLSLLRLKTTPPHEFRRALHKLALLLLMEAARQWETRSLAIETPLASFNATMLVRPVVLVPILRAGLGLQEGMIPLIPEASTGHVGIYRDPQTLQPMEYFSRFPNELPNAEVLVLDPMLATGGSAAAAVTLAKKAGARRLQLICVLASRPGIASFQQPHPDVPIIAAAIDPELNDHGYIVPGLGDAGDRYFGT